MVLDLTPRDICTVKDSLPTYLGCGKLFNQDLNMHCAVGWMLHECGVESRLLAGVSTPGLLVFYEDGEYFDGWTVMARAYGLRTSEVIALMNANDRGTRRETRRAYVAEALDHICQMHARDALRES